MESNEFLKKYISLLRFEKPYYNSLPFILFLVIALMTLNGMLEALMATKDDDKSIMTVSSLAVLSISSTCVISHSLDPKNVMKLMELIEEDFFVNSNDFQGREHYWEKIQVLHRKKKEVMKFEYRFLKITVVIMFSGFVFKNAITYLLGIPIYSDDQSEPWLTPFLSYTPPEFEPVAFFLYVYSLHTLLIIFCHLEAYLVLITVCLSTEKVLGDFETFYQLLDIFREDFSDSIAGNETPRALKQNNFETNKSHLKADMVRLVQCHQRITRNYSQLADSSAFIISAHILTIISDSCGNIFFMLKSNEVKKAAAFAIMFSVTNLLLFFEYYNGQRIFNQNDLLRKSIASLPWIDKPRWFRQTMHIMMIRANLDIENRPYGIFVLNYMSFKDLMKLTFSVGNVLYTRKLATQSQK